MYLEFKFVNMKITNVGNFRQNVALRQSLGKIDQEFLLIFNLHMDYPPRKPGILLSKVLNTLTYIGGEGAYDMKVFGICQFFGR